MRSAPLEMPQMRPVSRLSSLLFSLCVGSICFRRVTSWAVRAVRGRGSTARPAPAPLWLRRDTGTRALPRLPPLPLPLGSPDHPFLKKKSVTWCLMNCKLALQMEIFIFQFIWKRSGLRLLASFVLFIVCVCPCLCLCPCLCVFRANILSQRFPL